MKLTGTINKVVKCLPSTALLLAIAVSPALGHDAMSLGKTAYAKGDYAQARRFFEQAYNARPSYLPVYHIAACDVKLKDFNRAEQSYKQCITMTTDATVIKSCKAAIQGIINHRNSGGASHHATAHGGKTAGAAARGSSASVPLNRPYTKEEAVAIANGNDIEAKKRLLVQLETEQKRNLLALKLVNQASEEFRKRREEAILKREAIIEKGKIDAQKAREKGHQEVRQAREESNWLCRNTATGELSINLPTDIEEEILEKWENEAQRIIRDSEHRASAIRIPEHDNTAEHMVSTLQDKSVGGTKLHHEGTNLYVRSYTHTPKLEKRNGPAPNTKPQVADKSTPSKDVSKQLAGTPTSSSPTK